MQGSRTPSELQVRRASCLCNANTEIPQPTSCIEDVGHPWLCSWQDTSNRFVGNQAAAGHCGAMLTPCQIALLWLNQPSRTLQDNVPDKVALYRFATQRSIATQACTD
eukprot:TRINITY_DN38197_c0_g1_i1.p2 TRINITY_DN38197_c0_g1~~TRINITY_DN38197_c0_g1_i1.p2  ORF type:complete len:108 (-),score=15.82 TRINITY_DN38197_c0_g1_i1:24-347(-)